MLTRNYQSVCQRCLIRSFSTTSPLLSGHSRWSKIKHDKGKADAIKNRQRSQFAREIASASKAGGPDINANPRLADLVTKAKREGFAKTGIEAAIARGQGQGASGEKLESVTLEGILPGNIGLIVDCETDSKARTMMTLRHALKEAGGNATPSAYLFEKKGRVVFEAKEGVGVDEVLVVALDAGATDIESDDDGDIVVSCEPEDTAAVSEMVAKALKLQAKASEIVWAPVKDTLIDVASEQAAVDLGAFIDELNDREPGIAVTMNVAPGNLSTDTWQDLQSRLRV